MRTPLAEKALRSPGMVLRLVTMPDHVENARRHVAGRVNTAAVDALHVDQQQVVLRPAGHDAQAVFLQLLGQAGGVGDDPLLQRAKALAVGQAAAPRPGRPSCSDAVRPARPGTARGRIVAASTSHRWVMIIAPRGPVRLLWVVVVTTSAMPMGLGCTPAATRPEMWAISARK